MVLKQQLPASSIAEVVMALTVIATCFGVASLVFVRVTKTVVRFEDVKMQTEIQSEILLKLYTQEELSEETTYSFTTEEDPQDEQLQILSFPGTEQGILWEQQWFRK